MSYHAEYVNKQIMPTAYQVFRNKYIKILKGEPSVNIDEYMSNHFLLLTKGRDPDAPDEEDGFKMSYLADSLYNLACSKISFDLGYRGHSENPEDHRKMEEYLSLIQETIKPFKLDREEYFEEDAILTKEMIQQREANEGRYPHTNYRNTCSSEFGHDMYNCAAIDVLVDAVETKYPDPNFVRYCYHDVHGNEYREINENSEYYGSIGPETYKFGDKYYKKYKAHHNPLVGNSISDRTNPIKILIILILGNLAEWYHGYYGDELGLFIIPEERKWEEFISVNTTISSDGGDDIIYNKDALMNWEKVNELNILLEKAKEEISELTKQKALLTEELQKFKQLESSS